MPPRNNPVPNAVKLFNCNICDKGYPRQVDYENHLRSYDHNHRQRLADMKKLTASNDPESNKPKAGLEMRSINVEESNKKPGMGSRFTKIGGPGGATGGGSRFKKVGVAVSGTKEAYKEYSEKKEPSQAEKVEAPPAKDLEEPLTNIQTEAQPEQDTTLVEEKAEEEEVGDDVSTDWEEYDFTKPTGATGCDHASCPGLKTEGIWSGKFNLL